MVQTLYQFTVVLMLQIHILALYLYAKIHILVLFCTNAESFFMSSSRLRPYSLPLEQTLKNASRRQVQHFATQYLRRLHICLLLKE